jgi:lysophospholipase L1-like esterase
MKLSKYFIFIFYFCFTGITKAQNFLSINGESLTKQSVVKNTKGTENPFLRIIRTKETAPKGTVFLLADENYALSLKKENLPVSNYLDEMGFDVVVLNYQISKIDKSEKNILLTSSEQAFKMLKNKCDSLKLSDKKFIIMGLGNGGNLAARTIQRLKDIEQPNDVVLISASNLNTLIEGTVIPAITPPLKPISNLLVCYYKNENALWINSGSEYTKTWIGYDGKAKFNLLQDPSSNKNNWKNNNELTTLLKNFLNTVPAKAILPQNPAAISTEGYSRKRHDEKLKLVANEKFDLIMIGNSITNNFEKPQYQETWNTFFAPRKALNLGFSGYRTENILWNIDHGELEGQSPKVVTLEMGTNNVDEKNYPTRHTANQLAGGIEEIVKKLRQKLPNTKIIILRSFPGCYGGPNPTSHLAILERASAIVSKLADGKNIFYCDVNHVFLNLDGSINQTMMPDWLHPSPEGTKAWARAMEPLLSELMGDSSLDKEKPTNTAIIPVPKLEQDGYDWYKRHAEVIKIKDSIQPEIVLIGNSISHFWGGEPKVRDINGKLKTPNGPKSWQKYLGQFRVLNLRFGWDRTQNVLWRLDHGELDALSPKTVIINIGTNNTSQTENARMNTAEEIVEGISAICKRVRSKVPHAKLIVMAIFPREKDPKSNRRILINEINRQLVLFT